MTTTPTQSLGRQRLTVKKFLFAALLTGSGLLVSGLVLTGKPAPVANVPPEPLRPVVSVLRAQPSEISLAVNTQGTVEARRRINLVAEVAGKVSTVSERFEEGAFFDQGDVLLQLEQADYEFAIARAQSQVAAAEQRLAEERGRNRQAKREWRELGTVEANALFLRQPQMKAAEAALKASVADLSAAQLALSRTEIRAPFSGRIESKRADLGQYIAPGAAVAEIYATDIVDVALPLNDSQLAALKLPMNANVALGIPVILSTAFGGREWQWQAQIRRVQAVVDRQSRTVNAIAEVLQPFESEISGRPPLTPGMFVRAEIPTPPIPNLVQLPASALRSDNTVLVVGTGEKLVRQPVTVQRRTEQWAWVSGLTEGSRIVRAQTGLLVVGLTVEVAGTAIALGDG
ncbi:MAG: efflux RND transporter periplasmic adaptor subunit [Halieaceae bacterium]|nr:efflux RND transporter periplasmic adaptor subunit [Halieaceae bacterium]MBT6265555.1 efflux RND transporter periplasmic adaptor subunit [Halieaceae bacterium]MBT6333253.1 efflux RND transporter periplasmic adaptor subunit [Halieaceae bacterium]MBT7340732.1 efflux RND transporter periplasmic adaptor subunit [Halieaceae bacterium]